MAKNLNNPVDEDEIISLIENRRTCVAAMAKLFCLVRKHLL
jgi:hypothetical protein